MPRSTGPDSIASPLPGDDSSPLSGRLDSFGLFGERQVECAAGTDLGGVTIVRLLADGGMGRVYEGRQHAPVRPVAVKILRDGLASRAIMRRFEQEAHLLARLRHPHIAQIHMLGTWSHAGATVPFFVMELVEGALPIDRFARERGLSVRERVDLLRRVAAAVAQGHGLGIVHRDVKPGNILVGADGEPKVIDFGVARSTDADLARATLQTDAGQLVGTLRYMSPEQFDADASRVGGATDVYALGLVLHELLAGCLPYDVRGCPIVVAARIIREQEPRVTQAIVRALGASAGGGAAISPDSARQLAAVVEKCLRKDPADRYASADELAADLGRWLVGEPVYARPESVMERVRRWLWRRRLPVAALSLVAVAALAAAVFSARADRQAALARQNLAEKQAEAYYSLVQRAAEAAGRRNIGIAASLLERARASGAAVPGRPAELACLGARLDDSIGLWTGPGAVVRGLAAASAGSGLVSGCDDGSVWSWEPQGAVGAGRSRRLGAHTAPVWAAALTSDGRLAATGAEDGTAIVWDIESVSRVGELTGHEGAVYGAAFSPDDRVIATASADGTVGLWDADSRQLRSRLVPAWRPAARDRNVYGVAFSPDGRTLAAACGDNRIRRWSTATGESLPDWEGHERRVFSVAFSPDGSRLASASEDRTARIWDAVNGREMAVLTHPLRVNAVAWSGGGDAVLTVSADAVVRAWNPEDGRLRDGFAGHRDAVWAISPTAEAGFVTASSDGTCRTWDARRGDEPVLACRRGARGGAEAGVRGVARSPDGRLLATASMPGEVVLWDGASCTRVRTIATGRGRVSAVDFAPSGESLVAACGDGQARIHRVTDGVETAAYGGHAGPVFAAVFSPDGRRLATAGVDHDQGRGGGTRARDGKGVVRVHDVAEAGGEGLAIAHPATAYGVAFSPDGARLASACADGRARIWDAATGRLLHTCVGHEDDVNWVAWSPDGTRVATASSDGTVRLWGAADGRPTDTLREPVGQVWEVAFSPDGSRLAGVGADGTLHLWHVHAGRHLMALSGHEAPVWSVVFTADGLGIVTGSDDGTARVWGAAPAEVRRRREQVRPR